MMRFGPDHDDYPLWLAQAQQAAAQPSIDRGQASSAVASGIVKAVLLLVALYVLLQVSLFSLGGGFIGLTLLMMVLVGAVFVVRRNRHRT
jgi:membrane-bound ClpP family serine protease